MYNKSISGFIEEKEINIWIYVFYIFFSCKIYFIVFGQVGDNYVCLVNIVRIK